MKVFLSWSKPKSQRFAALLRDWLPEVIQEIEPWMSSEDIQKGQRWAAEVGGQLGALSQGILCVTAENVREPWLNFEAGALAKSLEDAKVRPLLLDLRPSDVTGPLAQFQATVATDRDDMSRLVASLNSSCSRPLDDARLTRAFDREWKDYSEKISSVQKVQGANIEAEQRPSDDMIAEILDRVRQLERSSRLARFSPQSAFAVELRRNRKRLSLTIDDLAAATSIPALALMGLEDGAREPTIREVAVLDRFFDAKGLPTTLSASHPLSTGLARLIPQGPPKDDFVEPAGLAEE